MDSTLFAALEHYLAPGQPGHNLQYAEGLRSVILQATQRGRDVEREAAEALARQRAPVAAAGEDEGAAAIGAFPQLSRIFAVLGPVILTVQGWLSLLSPAESAVTAVTAAGAAGESSAARKLLLDECVEWPSSPGIRQLLAQDPSKVDTERLTLSADESVFSRLEFLAFLRSTLGAALLHHPEMVTKHGTTKQSTQMGVTSQCINLITKVEAFADAEELTIREEPKRFIESLTPLDGLSLLLSLESATAEFQLCCHVSLFDARDKSKKGLLKICQSKANPKRSELFIGCTSRACGVLSHCDADCCQKQPVARAPRVERLSSRLPLGFPAMLSQDEMNELKKIMDKPDEADATRVVFDTVRHRGTPRQSRLGTPQMRHEDSPAIAVLPKTTTNSHRGLCTDRPSEHQQHVAQ